MRVKRYPPQAGPTDEQELIAKFFVGDRHPSLKESLTKEYIQENIVFKRFNKETDSLWLALTNSGSVASPTTGLSQSHYRFFVGIVFEDFTLGSSHRVDSLQTVLFVESQAPLASLLRDVLLLILGTTGLRQARCKRRGETNSPSLAITALTSARLKTTLYAGVLSLTK